MNGSKAVTLKSRDVLKVYKSSYRISIPWEQVLDQEVMDWLIIFENGRNCSVPLTMSCLLSILPVMCGPNTSVATNEQSFSASLNTFALAVCDPGGGKMNT